MNLTPAFASVLAADVPPEAFGKIFALSFLAAFLVALLVFCVRILWLIFEKAGQEGWKALVPVYHHVIITRIAGVSAWWNLALLLLLPLVAAHHKAPKVLCLILLFLWWGWLCQRIAKRFGKGAGFGLGMTVPVVGFFFRVALAYDKSAYQPNP